jgi:asparagine synthase (glutamine-hydrolysing)
MCGIAGIVDLRGKRDVNEGTLRDMTDRLFHRGPDGSGYHIEPGTGFGHRRLSIIDVDGGHQPMYNEDKSVVVTFNGEIYDYGALFDELKSRGHTFHSRCDTETIVHAWEEWGESCLDRLKGMFAFALWDRNRETLFLARDRLGKKPLYYVILDNSMLIFASELKALMVHPLVKRSIDPKAVEDYMTFGYVPDPKTIFRGIHKLPPAHYLSVKRGEISAVPREYWKIRFDAIEKNIDEGHLMSELRYRLGESVRKRMIADVPLGAFLSGGVDSSAVVATMAASSDEPVNTCSISFGNPAYNESQFADRLAKELHTRHRTEQVDVDDFSLIDLIPAIYDEPFADSSSIPTYRVCELARKNVTVALSGDGGDEVFAGYRRYRWHMTEEAIRGRLSAPLRRALFGTAGALYPKLDRAPRFIRAKSTLQAIARDSLEAYLYSVSILPTDLHGRLFSVDFKRELQGYSAAEVFREIDKQCDTDDPLSRIQYLDMKTYLPGDILTKVDRASMAHSLEVRVPILDSDLVEWAGTIPSSLKLHGREGKYIFKKALQGMVPDSILYRDKMGFAVPIGQWLRGPLQNEVRKRLLSGAVADSGIFDRGVVASLIDEHTSGTRNHSSPIWALLVFAGFYDLYFGEAASRAAA